METWPTLLPAPNSDFSYTAQTVDVRSQVTEALLDQRHRYDGQIVLVSLTWQMDNVQLAAFESWHKFNINGGSDWFNIFLPVDGTDTLCVARFNDGIYGLSYKEGEVWLVNAKLDVDGLPNPVVLETDLDTALDDLSGIIGDDDTYMIDDEGNPIYYNV